MQPRIYVYKITFQEVPLYYIGVHKEKTFNEEYMGSPVTHKEKWQIYTPQKEILREFDYTDDGWLQAQDFEKELIRPVYNTDLNCLNESCGGRISLAINRAIGKKVWEDKTPEQRSKWLSRTTEQRSAAAKKGQASKSPEQRSAASRKGRATYLANSTHEQRSAAAKKSRATYLANSTPEQRSAAAKKGQASKSPEQRSAAAKKAIAAYLANSTPEQRSDVARKANATKFQCTITGHISNAGPLALYQRARGIDTSNRVKVIPSSVAS
jgi:hypothetical protein